MSGPGISRRDALHQIVGLAAVAGVLSACGKAHVQKAASACVDMEALSASEASMRSSAHYVEQSPDPAKPCKACTFFTAAGDGGACGSCQILSGPANANGHCDSWAGKS